MVLIIDDDIAVRTSLLLLLKSTGYEVMAVSGPDEAVIAITAKVPDLIILDLNFSVETSGEEGLALLRTIRQIDATVPIVLITGWGSIELAVAGMKLGANDFINKPWDNDYLIQIIKTLLDLQRTRPESSTRRELNQRYDFSQIVGEDPKMLAILETIGRVATTDASVLIMGQSGTGKELIAEALHKNSLRSTKPFIKVNLGGISSSLFESEMFGHLRGAFTDARYDRSGRFEIANKGTIFLDEIGDLDPGSQVKLLRVLQDRTYEVLGSSRTKTVDVRVICATNKNLHEQVSRSAFREDLLYRINLITVHLPALHERPGDIPLLVDHFLHTLRITYNRPNLSVTNEAIRWLQQLPLPGNIRQLKNLVERAVLVSAGDDLGIDELKAQLELAPAGRSQLPRVGDLTLEEIEVQMIKKTLEYYKNKISPAAQSLGLTRSSLYRRLDKYQIPYDETQD